MGQGFLKTDGGPSLNAEFGEFRSAGWSAGLSTCSARVQRSDAFGAKDS